MRLNFLEILEKEREKFMREIAVENQIANEKCEREIYIPEIVRTEGIHKNNNEFVSTGICRSDIHKNMRAVYEKRANCILLQNALLILFYLGQH